MLDDLIIWLKDLAVFIVLCETILSFAPSVVYKRYIKPFVGLILLLRISSFLIGNVSVDWNERVDIIFSDYEQSVSRYLENATLIEKEEIKDNVVQYNNANDANTKEEKLNGDLIKIKDISVGPIKIGEEQ